MDEIDLEQHAQALAGAWLAVLSIDDSWDRAWALRALLRALPPAEATDAAVPAMRAALDLFSDSELVTVLVSLVPDLPENLRAEAIGAALVAATAATNKTRDQSLSKVASHLSSAQLDTALACAVTLPGGESVLGDLAPYLSYSQLDVALRAANDLSGNGPGLYLTALLPYASSEQRASWGDAALAAVLRIAAETTMAETLAKLAPALSAEQLDRATAAATQLSSPPDRATAFCGLIPHCPAVAAELVEAVLEIAFAAGVDEGQRARTLNELLPQLDPARRNEVIAAWLARFDARCREPDADLGDCLWGLKSFSQLPPEVAEPPAAVVLARIVATSSRPRWWAEKLAPLLPVDQLPVAVAAASEITDELGRAGALSALAPRLRAEDVDAAWAVALTIEDPISRVPLMVTLAARLPGDRRATAIDAALTYACDVWADYPADPFLWLAPHLNSHQRPRAIAAALALDPEDRARALIAIARGCHTEREPEPSSGQP